MMSIKKTWTREARNILRSQITRSGLTYEQLAVRLEKLGVSETVSSVKGKIHRGTFSFVFVIQVMQAIDRDRIDIG